MPSDGDIEAVDPPQLSDSQVKVYAVPPRAGVGPAEIVDGFLEAMTSDDLQFATARKYLTKAASRGWDPGTRTTLLADGPSRRAHPRTSFRDALQVSATYQLSGREVAVIDKQHVYRAEEGKYQNVIHLVRQDDKEWRIDYLPAGLLLSLSDFRLRNYHSVNKYYFAPGPSSGASGRGRTGEDWLVADPVYLRQGIDPETRMDPLTQAVASLLTARPTG